MKRRQTFLVRVDDGSVIIRLPVAFGRIEIIAYEDGKLIDALTVGTTIVKKRLNGIQHDAWFRAHHGAPIFWVGNIARTARAMPPLSHCRNVRRTFGEFRLTLRDPCTDFAPANWFDRWEEAPRNAPSS